MKLKKHFSFRGRISRKDYLLYQIIVGIPVLVFHLIYRTFLGDTLSFSFILFALITPLHIILICKAIQRLHDINLPGIMILLPLAFLANPSSSTLLDPRTYLLIFEAVLLLKKGNPHSNKYGVVPLD